MEVGVPQGSSLRPYLFIVFHCDVINCLGAHSAHWFADDFGVLIKTPVTNSLTPMLEYVEKEGSKICQQVYAYSKKWKQPINVARKVAQLFHTQVKRPKISNYNDERP